MNLTSLIMELQMLHSAQLQQQLALKLIENATEGMEVVKSPVVGGEIEKPAPVTKEQKIDIRV